jgi:hypothetical protein
MGISRREFLILQENKVLTNGKDIVSLGNPFFSRAEVQGVLTPEQTKYCFSLPRNQRASWVFLEILGASSFDILDISAEEGANLVFDLNLKDAKKELYERYDLILDLGTQEHIFDNSSFFLNVLSMLRVSGCYLFAVPANNMLEHGFRQYSPTFFYDLCAHNSDLIKLNCLVLYYGRGLRSVDMLDLYKKLDPEYFLSATGSTFLVNRVGTGFGRFTGIVTALLNFSAKPTMVMGLISKVSKGELRLSASQCIYRVFRLGEVAQNNDGNLSSSPKLNYLRVLKSMIIFFPLPVTFKICFLSVFARVHRYVFSTNKDR